MFTYIYIYCISNYRLVFSMLTTFYTFTCTFIGSVLMPNVLYIECPYYRLIFTCFIIKIYMFHMLYTFTCQIIVDFSYPMFIAYHIMFSFLPNYRLINFYMLMPFIHSHAPIRVALYVRFLLRLIPFFVLVNQAVWAFHPCRVIIHLN